MCKQICIEGIVGFGEVAGIGTGRWKAFDKPTVPLEKGSVAIVN